MGFSIRHSRADGVNRACLVDNRLFSRVDGVMCRPPDNGPRSSIGFRSRRHLARNSSTRLTGQLTRLKRPIEPPLYERPRDVSPEIAWPSCDKQINTYMSTAQTRRFRVVTSRRDSGVRLSIVSFRPYNSRVTALSHYIATIERSARYRPADLPPPSACGQR